MDHFDAVSLSLLSLGFAATATVFVYGLRINQANELERSHRLRVKRQLKRMFPSTTEQPGR